MYEVTVKTGFSAAHQLRLYDGKYENLHGHNWSAQVTVEADELDTMGVGIDFVKLKQMVEEILGKLDYQNINEIPPFDELNPSAENIAHWLFHELKEQVNSQTTRVKRVEICEMEGCGASYFES
ncbi:MAG: 6-carboxytetrahydropterin synthase [Nitrospinae bacterium]|nr:6-carboxytetrahydropterin synthase [Nitrospinota bacterium]MZH42031.1 6-carboxytetrahydropterin synthase [Nitrospinota bacterium]